MHEERDLSVTQDLEETFRSLGITEIAKIHEKPFALSEPGHLVPEHFDWSIVLNRRHLQLSGIGIHIQINVLVQLAVVHHRSFLEGRDVPVIGTVVSERESLRQAPPEEGRLLLGHVKLLDFLRRSTRAGQNGCDYQD